MRAVRLVLLALAVAVGVAVARRVLAALRGSSEHDADDDMSARGSVDHWPAVPRRPGA